jgi:hypothetical protein
MRRKEQSLTLGFVQVGQAEYYLSTCTKPLLMDVTGGANFIPEMQFTEY